MTRGTIGRIIAARNSVIEEVCDVVCKIPIPDTVVLQFSRVTRSITIISVVSICAQTALAQGLIPTRASADAKAKTSVARTGERRINFELIDALLNPALVSGTIRNDVRNAVITALQERNADTASIRAALRNANFSAPQLNCAVQVLNEMSAPVATESSQLLTSSTSAGTTDRLYGNVEVFRFQTQRFSLRMVTSVAVSDANLYDEDDRTLSLAKRDSASDFRTQTAQLLSTIQDGGPFAVHGSHAWQKTLGENWTLQSGIIMSIARSGIVQSGGSALYGLATEFRLGSRPPISRDNQTSESISFLLRLGTRVSNNPLLAETKSKHASFAQLIVEGRPRGSRVPIGVAVSGIAERALRPYPVKLQVFGSAGL